MRNEESAYVKPKGKGDINVFFFLQATKVSKAIHHTKPNQTTTYDTKSCVPTMT